MDAVQCASPPWAYDVNDPSCAKPLGLRLIDMDHVLFTQSHINDSFSHEMRPVLEMVNALLRGDLDQREIPVVRVAWRSGAFWSIDNRRTFVFKHCKVGRACLEVCEWTQEFDMKLKGGSAAHEQSGGGKRAGLVQRLKDLAFPCSDVIAFDMTKNDVSKLMDSEEQAHHDGMVSAFMAKRQRLMSLEDLICAKVKEPWQFEASISETRWIPATIWQAHVDGTFDAIVLDGSVQMFRPRLVAKQLRQFQPGLTLMPPVQHDLKALNMQMPAGTPTRLQIAWCALCGMDVGGDPRNLRVHEKQAHPERGGFACSSCTRTFSCSDDLRKHSRSTQHEIPAAFGRYLRNSLTGECSDNDREDSEEPPQRPRVKGGSVSDTSTALVREKAVFVVKGESGERGATKTRCGLCRFECSAKDLVSHEERHHKREEFKCQSCHATFTCSKNLRKHSRSTCHHILCIFMLDKEKEQHEASENSSRSALIDAEDARAPESVDDAEMVELASQTSLPQDAVTLWWHAQSGIRLMERIGNQAGGSNARSSPSWTDCVLEKWRGDGGRCYLYCPATSLWFWEDEAATSGWCREVLHKN